MEGSSPATRQVAEYAMALDLCSELTQIFDEDEVLHRILGIFSTLFAPKQVILWVMEDGSQTSVLTFPESGDIPPAAPGPASLPETLARGFRLRIPYKDGTVAIVGVDGLAFPEYRDRYLSLSLGIAGICGLAVSNARAHSRLEGALSDLRNEYLRSFQLGEELRIANEELEDRVRRRTAELETAMISLREEVRQRTAAEETIRSQLEEKNLLLREVHHRVKNNLQLITSMLSLQARKVADPRLQLALSESRNRIRIMSIVHEKLWTARNLARIDLAGLVRQIPSNLLPLFRIPPDSVSISLTIAPVVVDINTAIPLALILNELFSNSLKHAFPDGRAGEIVLDISTVQDGLSIRFSDNGVGLPPGYDWEDPDSVGLVLVNTLVRQLQGTIAREPGAGTRFLIQVQNQAGESGTLRGTYNQIAE